MKINSISQNINTCLNIGKSKFPSKGFSSALTKPQTDTFTLNNHLGKSVTKEIFSKTQKFSIREYEKLTPYQIDVLRKVCNDDLKAKKAAEASIDMALMLKPYLDEEFGEDKYVFVSVGRSPAGIARVLEFMGVETKYLPISDLRYYEDIECVIGSASGLREYQTFLARQGINNYDLTTSNKEHLICDYTHSGKSLSLFKQLLSKVYKIDEYNIRYLSLNQLLKFAAIGDAKKQKETENYILDYFQMSGIEEYSGISYLPVTQLNYINNKKKYSNNNAKKFNFLIIDELNKRGLLKENPKNKKSL